MDQEDPMDHQDQLVKMVSMEIEDRLVNQENLVSREKLEALDSPDLMVNLDTKE